MNLNGVCCVHRALSVAFDQSIDRYWAENGKSSDIANDPTACLSLHTPSPTNHSLGLNLHRVPVAVGDEKAVALGQRFSGLLHLVELTGGERDACVWRRAYEPYVRIASTV